MSYTELTSSDLQVLSGLLTNRTLTANAILDEVGYTAAQFTICIEKLIALGCQIATVGPGEYGLEETGLGVWEDYLNFSLNSSPLSLDQVRVYQETASTQDLAKSLIPAQALVLTNQQTAGRGRLGRSWQSQPDSCVLMSIGKRITGMTATHDRVSMIVGIAVARAIEKTAPGVTVMLKWPNDVMIGRRKLAGILIEGISGMFIIGIGLNVASPPTNEPELRETATSLSELGQPIDRLRVIEVITHQLGSALRETDTAAILDEWRARAALGQTQTFEQAGQRVTGEVLDLDPDHGLIVRRDTGEIVTLPAATTSVVK